MNDELKAKLTELGLTEEQIQKLETDGGVTIEAELVTLDYHDVREATGCTILRARQVVDAFAPAVSTPAPVAATAPTYEEATGVDAADLPEEDRAVIPEGTAPQKEQVDAFAALHGLDSSMLMPLLLMGGGGGGLGGLNIADMISPAQIVPGYRPKIRNISYILMDQLQRSLDGLPIVVINDDGSVNVGLTIQYVLELQEGNEPAEDNVYWDTGSNSYQIIKVGVDMQSIYDADPVDPVNRVLQASGFGKGRINWTNVPLDVRQVVFYAVTQTHELDPNDEPTLGRLRDRIKPGISRSSLRTEFPKAITAWNEANRTGSLPTMRKQQTNRGARRPEIATRRRAGSPRDLSDYPRDPALVRGDDWSERNR